MRIALDEFEAKIAEDDSKDPEQGEQPWREYSSSIAHKLLGNLRYPLGIAPVNILPDDGDDDDNNGDGQDWESHGSSGSSDVVLKEDTASAGVSPRNKGKERADESEMERDSSLEYAQNLARTATDLQQKNAATRTALEEQKILLRSVESGNAGASSSKIENRSSEIPGGELKSGDAKSASDSASSHERRKKAAKFINFIKERTHTREAIRYVKRKLTRTHSRPKEHKRENKVKSLARRVHILKRISEEDEDKGGDKPAPKPRADPDADAGPSKMPSQEKGKGMADPKSPQTNRDQSPESGPQPRDDPDPEAGPSKMPSREKGKGRADSATPQTSRYQSPELNLERKKENMDPEPGSQLQDDPHVPAGPASGPSRDKGKGRADQAMPQASRGPSPEGNLAQIVEPKPILSRKKGKERADQPEKKSGKSICFARDAKSDDGGRKNATFSRRHEWYSPGRYAGSGDLLDTSYYFDDFYAMSQCKVVAEPAYRDDGRAIEAGPSRDAGVVAAQGESSRSRSRSLALKMDVGQKHEKLPPSEAAKHKSLAIAGWRALYNNMDPAAFREFARGKDTIYCIREEDGTLRECDHAWGVSAPGWEAVHLPSQEYAWAPVLDDIPMERAETPTQGELRRLVFSDVALERAETAIQEQSRVLSSDELTLDGAERATLEQPSALDPDDAPLETGRAPEPDRPDSEKQVVLWKPRPD